MKSLSLEDFFLANIDQRRANDYLIKTDMEGNYTYVSNSFCERLGLIREEVIGISSMTHIIPEDHQKCFHTIEKCIENPNKSFEVILRKPLANGEYCTNKWEFMALTNSSGVPYEFVCTGRDISKREGQELTLKAFFALANDLFAIANFKGYFEHLNPAWVKLLGYELEELKSKQIFEFIHPEDHQHTQEIRQRLIKREEERVVIKNRYQKKNGDIVWLAWSACADHYSKKIYAVARDITQLKKRQDLQDKLTASLFKLSQKGISSPFTLESYTDFLVKEVAQTLNVSSVSIWDYVERPTGQITQQKKYLAPKGEFVAHPLATMKYKDAPLYFEKLQQQQVLSVENVWESPLGLEDYWKETGTTSFLDVQISLSDEAPSGLICTESLVTRKWEYEEKKYLESAAYILAKAYSRVRQEDSVKRLSQSQQLLQIITGNIGEGIYRSTTESILFANNAFISMMGYTNLTEIQKVSPEQLYADREERDYFLKKMKDGGFYTDTRVRFRRKDGTTFLGSVNVKKTITAEESYFDGSIRDITTQIALEEEVQKLAEVSRHTSDAIVACNEKGRIMWANQANEEIFGVSISQLLGNEVTDVLHYEQTDKKAIKKLKKAIRKKEAHQVVIKLKGKAGRKLRIAYEVNPIFDKLGSFDYTIVTKRDVTDLLNRQDKLASLLKTANNQNERLREYSYIISHNIRSSVANILGLIELLKMETSPNNYIDMVLNSTLELEATIQRLNTLLQLNDESKAPRELKKEACELHTFVENCTEQLQVMIQEKEVRIQLHYDPEQVIYAVPAYLESILHNLLVNAIKYGVTHQQKTIEIDCQETADTTMFSVKDYGYGINLQKHKSKIFKLGTRLHEMSKGKGMGLHLTKRQVENMGGEIEVESEPLKGTTFFVHLPKE